jgi:uncharacterized integral membrane protein (TIGR00697 family)
LHKQSIRMSEPKWLMAVVSLFIAALLSANIIAVKLVDLGTYPFIGSVIVDAGIIIFPISYILGDVLTEVYGFRIARSVILYGFLANLILVVCISISDVLPAATLLWQDQDSYSLILGFSKRLLVASFAAYLVGEFVNSYIMATLKVRTEGKFLFVRTILSTLVGQALDSTIFVFIAFSGIITFDDMIMMVAVNWLLKVTYEIIGTPLTYATVNFLKRSEDIDIYDRDLNSNFIRFAKSNKRI